MTIRPILRTGFFSAVSGALLTGFLFLWLIPKAGAAEPIVKTGAERTELYLHLLQGKNVGLVVNHTSVVKDQHLVDYLMGQKIMIKKIFAPEHGFRGEADAGEKIGNATDDKTGIPIISIYGNNTKPTPAQLSGIDLLIFDIQDVGCRFYTYISTLHYVMEACAENGKKLIILDRPNPNGDYCDGPILKPAFRSFVGVDPIPVVHGCTVGELARMINNEGWLKDKCKCDLTVIPVEGYTHQTIYEPPIKPSPNLPNLHSIRLYPSLCLFEATSVSIGRGTTTPFQVIGYPKKQFGSFSFTPTSLKGFDTNPLHKDRTCYGDDLRNLSPAPKFTLRYFLEWMKKFDNKEEFLTRANWFNQLIGNDTVLQLINEGKSEEEIRESWKSELGQYKQLRKKYLLYPDANNEKPYTN